MNRHDLVPLVISSCLTGVPCRYDGKDNCLPEETLRRLEDHFLLIPVCPEVLGGLPTPRIPSEIQGDGRILNRQGADVSREFRKGAELALKAAETAGASLACLKAHSPSCGNRSVYDGTFSGVLRPGKGVTVNLFEKTGKKVYNENEIDSLIGETTHVRST
ncbi:MAG: DUF523 domain-containing protein [Candidatus Marinimicrobia bacterium]|nr:DUF523 domain-containing protein [Candidatus Neomarinimicrobiota bacterium]